ncbi:MAG: acireductone synthase [Myxococcota bacterium]
MSGVPAVLPPAPPFGRLKLAIFDIEGTTTSIAFVYDVLFPYARAALGDFLALHWDEPHVQDAAQRMGAGAGTSPQAAAARALELMDGDVKDTGLKALQGLVWSQGYADGTLRGHVFADVPAAFAGLAARDVAIAIYSSGSVAAQKLIFGCSEAGDLTPAIAAWFDTTTGPKKDPQSYLTIVQSLGVAPAEAVFFTDNLDEARAARAAGLDVRVMLRPGNPALPPGHGFEEWSSFAALVVAT